MIFFGGHSFLHSYTEEWTLEFFYTNKEKLSTGVLTNKTNVFSVIISFLELFQVSISRRVWHRSVCCAAKKDLRATGNTVRSRGSSEVKIVCSSNQAYNLLPALKAYWINVRIEAVHIRLRAHAHTYRVEFFRVLPKIT